MKKIIIFFFLLFSFIILISCTKTETKTVTVTVTDTLTVVDSVKPAPTIVGIWIGTYEVTGSSTNYYYSFDLRQDGTMLYKGVGADGNTYYGQGTYLLTGTSFSFSFTALNLSQAGTVQTGSGTYVASPASISGTWINMGAPSGGTFTVTKAQ